MEALNCESLVFRGGGLPGVKKVLPPAGGILDYNCPIAHFSSPEQPAGSAT